VVEHRLLERSGLFWDLVHIGFCYQVCQCILCEIVAKYFEMAVVSIEHVLDAAA
jgi:hypothetical protein